MKGLVLSLFVICCLVSIQGKPGLLHASGDFGSYGGNAGGNAGEHAHIELVGVPDIHGYSGLQYPHFDIQDLGTVYHGEIPPKVVKISNTFELKVPKPYPVKIPFNVPYPVHIDKPYPVPVTQLVKVPQPVPVEVIKTVQVPVEVPKPYPVPHNEHSQGYGSGGLDSYGGSNNYNDLHQALGSGGYEGSSGGFEGSSGHGDSYNNENSYDKGYQGQDDKSTEYGAIAPSSDNYQVKQNQEES